MDSSIWGVLLLLIGVLLLVAEVFIPSGGMISILAVTCLVGATWCAWSAWWIRSPIYFWTFLATMAMLLPTVVSVAFYIWPNTPIGRKAILEAPTQSEIASFVELEEKLARLVGATGEAVTLLNPAGIIRVNGQRVHCQSEGSIIEQGTMIKITSVQGNRVVVRPCPTGPAHTGLPPVEETPASRGTAGATAAPQGDVVVNREASHTPPLDFDLP